MINYLSVYWQFKNGSLAEISIPQALQLKSEEYYAAWDRSLGEWVMYER